MSIRKRWCYWILPEQFDPGLGYVPVVITEGEPGYIPLRGGPGGRPWYWGIDYNEAMRVAREANEAENGLSLADTVTIVQSSMLAGPVVSVSDG